MFNSIHESGLYSVEDKEVNMREMAFADSMDELNASSATNGPQLSGECCNRVYQYDCFVVTNFTSFLVKYDFLGINNCDCLSENQPSSHFQIYHFGAL